MKKNLLSLFIVNVLVFGMPSCNAQITTSGSLAFKPYEIRVDRNFSVKTEIAKLEVPENRQVANGNKITIQMVRLKSTAEKPGPPIIYLSGGPGVSGISMLKTERLIVFETLRKFGDVILPDQRGTGITEPIMTSGTPLDLPLDKPIDAKESLDAFYAKMKKSKEELKEKNIDINAYNTVENAADIDDIRKALGADKMILWGYSYGSHLALAVIKQYGQFVDKAILSGVNGLDQRFRMPTDVNEVFNEIDKLLDKQPKLRKLIPSFPLLVKQELEKLDRQPATATFVEQDGDKITVTIGRTDVEIFTAINLASIAFVRELPSLFYDMSQGNYSNAAQYAYKVLKERPEGTPMSYSMHYASGCSAERMKQILETEKKGTLRNAINYPFITDDMKKIWDITDLGDNFRKPFTSSVPVMLMSGNLDGRTSISDARVVKKQFPNSVHVIFNNASHDLLAPQLVNVMENYLKGDLKKDLALNVPNFDFYSPNSFSLTLKFCLMLSKEGVGKFRDYFTQLCSPGSDTDISNTLILPAAYNLIKMKQPELAIEALKIDQSIFKEENWQIYNALGDAYRESGNKEEAEKNYRHSLELNPLNFSAYKKLNK